MAVTDAELISIIVKYPAPYDAPLKWVPTEFERLLETHGLNETTCLGSAAVRKWCGAHKNSRYVPESVLKHFDLHVSHTDFGEDTPTCQVIPI